MNCTHARRLFAAFWDDETTQAEREWLEGHFASCPTCRREYEQYARTLEVLGSLPRIEAAPDLAERALQRARRAETAPDRLPQLRPQWVPITAGVAAAVLLTLTVLGPWLGARNSKVAERSPVQRTLSEPVLVNPPQALGTGSPLARNLTKGAPLPDSLFDHTADVEFILDPVTLHRGRASVAHSSGPTQGERAVITF
jgi:hypothetical protein